MMSRSLRLAMFGALLSLFAGTAMSAEEAASKPQTYAVIVGVGEFEDAQLKPRPTAIADAQAFYDLIIDKKYLGADPKNVELLISGKDEKRDAKEATKANILAAIKEVAKKAKKDDTVLILFSGQGASAGEKTCYFASDSTFKDRVKNAVLSNEIADAFKDAKSERLLAMLDINFKSFDAGKESVVEPKLGDMLVSFFGIEKQDDQNLPTGRAVIFASTGPVSLNLEKNGLFVTSVLDALKGAADEEGGEADGVVTIDELQTYIEKNVPDLARKVGTTREEKEQLPFSLVSSAHFVLTKNPKVYAKVEARLEKLTKLDREQKITKEVAKEGAQLLSRMPKLKAFRELRKNYEQMVDGTLDIPIFLEGRAKILDGMKLGEADAKAFARKVLAGIDSVAEVYIKELNPGEMVGTAIKGMFQRLEETMPSELKDRVAKSKDLTQSEMTALLIDARLALGKREDLEGNKDADLALAYTLSKLDPYTTYIDKEQLRRMQSQLTGRFTGIGVQIRRDLVRDGLLVVTPIKGSPAYKAGLAAGDLITKIIRPVDSDGEPLDPPEELSTKGMKVDDAVKKIMGQPNTKVKLVVDREGVAEPLMLELTRASITVESVLGFQRKADDNWDFYIDPKNKIGYIHLTQFAERSYTDMLTAVSSLQKQGVKGLILDLRNNPGGYLNVANDICDLFIDDGLIVTVRPRVGQPNAFAGKSDGSLLNFPMVVLVNGGSASGSEILSACLQDHERAIVMGERSYGKGSVQNVKMFPQTGGMIKMTTATFWRPNNKNLNKSSIPNYDKMTPEDLAKESWGVRPDKNYLIELTPQERGELETHMRDREIIARKDDKAPKKEPKEFKDRQLDAAVEYLRSQIKATAQNPTK